MQPQPTAQISANCPRCRTKQAAFTMKVFGDARTDSIRGHVGRTWQDAFAVCAVCRRGVVITLTDQSRDGGFEIIDMAPCYAVPIPNHLPENIRRVFEQGIDNLPRNFDAAGSMYRKSLDLALKDKFPDIKGNLKERINKAAEQHGLTPALTEWAHKIRVDGNESSHGQGPFSQADAQRLSSLTDLVLRYLYTLPGMLEQAQTRRKPQDSTPPRKEPKQDLPNIPRLRGGSG